jgi:hypothetical protein
MHLQLMKPDETGMRFFEFRAILVDGRARGAAEVAGRAALRRGFETKGAAHRLPRALADSASLSQAACWPPLVCQCDDLTRSLCTLLGPSCLEQQMTFAVVLLIGRSLQEKSCCMVARCGCSHLACPLHRSSRRIETFLEKREASARHAFAAPICCS